MASDTSLLFNLLGIDNVSKVLKGIADRVAGLGGTFDQFGIGTASAGKTAGLALGGVGVAGAGMAAAVIAASAASVLAVGGLGIAVAAQTEEVKASFAGMTDGLTAAVEESAAAYVPMLVDLGADLRGVLDGPVVDSMTSGMEKALPIMDSLMGQVPGIVESALPVFDAFVDAGAPIAQLLVDDIGPGVDLLMGALEPLPGALGESGVQLISGLAEPAGRLVTAIGPLLESLVRLGGPIPAALLPPVVSVAAALAENLTPAVERVTPFLTTAANGVGSLIGFLEPAAPVILGVVGAVTAWSAIQGVLNVVLAANPIGLVVIAIAALVAGIVWVATQTTFFQDTWRVVWGAIQSATGATVDFLGRQWARITEGFGQATRSISGKWDEIKAGGVRVMDWIRGIPGMVSGAFGGLADIISRPFRSAFNGVAGYWNSTVGSLSFSIPSWVPGVGGKGFDVPNIPRLAQGGIVKATSGGTLALIGEGGQDEAVVPLPRGGALGGGGPVVLELRSDGSSLMDAMVEVIRKAVRTRGGDVQLTLGGAA